uniref:TrmE-type G domain-containing protein n=1 Tax=Parastrongyloides trichosuri TaxID=131310 RepID=A0A0N5A5K6_PARTI
MYITKILKYSQNLRHNIYAVSSGSLPSAIAIVRLSGKDSLDHIKKLTRKTNIIPRQLFYSPLYDKKNNLIDRSMVVYLDGPNTFTGEDTVEFFVHGSRAVVRCLCDELSTFHNTDSAKAGEFTRRALLNSKMNVAQVEALSDLISADSESQRQQALKSDSIGSIMKPLRKRILKLTSHYEALIDFAEDVVEMNNDSIIGEAKEIINYLNKLIKSSHRGTLIKEGINVVLIGKTNVGKSSLMNCITEKDISIISNIHGTTRDYIETKIQLNGYLVTITDTAGIRNNSNDILEIEGIRRSIKKANNADIIVMVIDGSNCNNIMDEVNFLKKEIEFNNKMKCIICINKKDLFNNDNLKVNSLDNIVSTSTINSNGIDELINILSKETSNIINMNSINSEFILSQQRHIQLVKKSKDSLENFIKNSKIDSAIAGEDLRDCCNYIGEITGVIVNEDILDNIFSTFCIGK